MAKELTANPQYVTITCPEAGDARTAASVEAGLQDLADCTEFLRIRVTGAESDDMVEGSLSGAFFNIVGVFNRELTYVVQTTAGACAAVFELFLPKGIAKITSYAARLRGNQGGTSHTSVPATKPVVSLLRQSGSGGAFATVHGPTADPSTTVGEYDGPHDVGASISHNIVLGDRYFIEVDGEADADSEDGALGILNVWITVSPV